MNINQLLNPVSASSSSRPQAPLRFLDPYLEHEHGSSATGNCSSVIHHSTTNHVCQDTRVSGSETLVAKRYVRNTDLTSNVNEPTTQSYGVSLSYVTHGRLPFLTTPPYPSDPRHFQYTSAVASSRHDISSQLPIQDISLNSIGSSCAGLTMAPTRRVITSQAGESAGAAPIMQHNDNHVVRKSPSSVASSDVASSDAVHEANMSEDEECESDRDASDMPRGFQCTFVQNCKLTSPDRKVISHFFGRNKKATRAIPIEAWAPFCRRHYQRTRYRNVKNFGMVQMDLVRMTVKNLEAWGGIAHFELVLRKRTMQALKREDQYRQEVQNARANGRTLPPALEASPCPDRWLLGYLGKKKSFQDVSIFVDTIEKHVRDNNCKPPEFEILPIFKPGQLALLEAKSHQNVSKPVGRTKGPTRRGSSSSHSAARSRKVVSPQTTPKTTSKVITRSRTPNVAGTPTRRLVRGTRRA